MKTVDVRKMKEGNNVIEMGNDNNATHIEKELDTTRMSEDALSPTFEVDAMKDAEKALRLVKKQVINDFRLKVKEIDNMLFKVKKMKKLIRLAEKGDRKGAHRIAEQLHDKNIAIGSLVLAHMHHYGYYVDEDLYMEVMYLEKAAALGFEPAIEMMKGLDEFLASETDISSRYALKAMLRFMAK